MTASGMVPMAWVGPLVKILSWIVDIPDFDTSRYSPMFLTTSRVYGEHYLRDYDSGITMPKKIGTEIRRGDRLEIEYKTGGNPRLKMRVKSSTERP